jgi:hypothetical protein
MEGIYGGVAMPSASELSPPSSLLRQSLALVVLLKPDFPNISFCASPTENRSFFDFRGKDFGIFGSHPCEHRN